MSLWETQFKDHPLWRTMEQARATMNAIQIPEDRSDRDALSYAGMVLELLEKRREDSDAREISSSMLALTNDAAANFAVHLGHVQVGQYTWSQVTPTTDALVHSLGMWPPMKIAHYMSGLNAAVEGFERRALEAADRIQLRAGEVEGNISALAAKQDELDATIAAERQRITEAIATFTADSREAVTDWVAEQEGELTARTHAWDEALSDARVQATKHSAQMAEYEAKSRKVLEAVGVNSTATDFGSYAKEQRKAADSWRRGAAIVFLLAGAWFIYSGLPSITDGNEGSGALWESSLARLGVTAAVAGVGAYAARESAQHRRQERQAKQVQLVLTALEPFIVNLPEDEQNEIRGESARAIFVLRTADAVDTDESGSPYVELMKGMLAKIPDRT